MKWWHGAGMAGFVAAAGLAALALSAVGEQEKGPAIDAGAAALMHRVSDYYGSLSSLACDMAVRVSMERPTRKHTTTALYTVAMERPNKFAVVLKEGENGATVVCDGDSLYTYVPALKKYSVEPAPESIDKFLLEKYRATALVGPGGAFAYSLLATKPYDLLMDAVKTGKDYGLEENEKLKLHHARFEEEQFAWDIWVQSGERPLVQKVAPDLSKLIAQVRRERPELPEMKVDMEVTFTNWAPNEKLTADRFKFTPPAGAEKIDTFFPKPKAPPAALAPGKPAPTFKAKLLDGPEMDLKSYIGKKVVVLDFWATWCPPCRKSLPILAEVTAAFEHKGVVFFAVNVGDEPAEARKFLQDTGLKITVALDPDGSIATSYGVTGIPHSVIIGKDGKIARLHVGLSPQLKEVLQKDLSDLTGGGAATEQATQPAPSP